LVIIVLDKSSFNENKISNLLFGRTSGNKSENSINVID
jgi:hypothetical protein